MTAQMNLHTFVPLNPISTLGFLKNSKHSCNIKNMHGDAAIKLLNFLVNKSATAALKERLGAVSTNTKSSQMIIVKSRYFFSYLQVVKVLMESYATDEVVPQTVSAITLFSQRAGMNPSKHAEELVAKTLCYGDEYEEYALI